MSISSKLKLFLSFLFLAAISNALLTYQLDKFGEKKLNWVNHTHEVLTSLNKLLANMTDAETGQRGFLLTRNDTYLNPYFLGLSGAQKEFDVLKNLTQDNLEQQQRLQKIDKLMQLKFTELAQTIRLKQEQKEGEIDKALLIVTNNKGKKHMDDMRVLLQEIEHAEKILLEIRKGDYKAFKASVSTLIIVEIMFFIFLAFMSISFLNKSLFSPMRLLLESTHKMEDGIKIDISDITSKDEMGYLLSSFYKMNEKVQHRQETLTHTATHDELTGLLNRTKMHDAIEEAIQEAQKSENKCAVLFIDLNKFKELNDTLGHDAGDLMLKEVASRLEKSVRNENGLFRIGGDEFLVLIKNLKNTTDLETILSNILKNMKEPIIIDSKEVDISLSIGVSIAPDDSTNNDVLIKNADVAMYIAKKNKNLPYTFFDKTMLKRATDS